MSSDETKNPFIAIFSTNPLPPLDFTPLPYSPPLIEILHPVSRLILTVPQPTLSEQLWRSYENDKWAVCQRYPLKGQRHRAHNAKRLFELGKVWIKYHGVKAEI